jgi:FAD synthase
LDSETIVNRSRQKFVARNNASLNVQEVKAGINFKFGP